MTKSTKQYLGDSVYAEIDAGMIKLTTENGLPTDPSNIIYIDLHVFDALVNYGENAKNNPECQTEQYREN